MIQRLKTLLVAVSAIIATGAISASGANAATEFHSDRETTTLTASSDGTGKTGHQVIDFGYFITCKDFTAQATANFKTFTTIELSNLAYSGDCTITGGGVVTLEMNGCSFTLTSDTAGAGNGQMAIDCPGANEISFTGVCEMRMGPQGPLNTIKYHTVGLTSNNTTEITVEPNITGIHYEASGPLCIKTGTNTDAAWTTGNFLITGEEDKVGGAMTSVWWG